MKKSEKNRIILFALGAIIILLLPNVLSTYGIKLTSELYIMSIFALSLGLIMGYAGLPSFGHAAFFGLGAYTVALVGKFVDSSYVLIVAAIAIGGLMALLTGLLFVRNSGAYLIMLTMAFNQLLYVLFYKLTDYTGGADGMSVSVRLDLGFGPLTGAKGMYYFTAICLLGVFALLYYLVKSPVGRISYGSKVNDHRMKALGYNTYWYKVFMYTVGGMLAGFAGALYGYYNSFVSPDSIHWGLSGQALIMVVIGGSGTLIGPPIGAAVFVILQNYISSYTDRWPLIMGILFIALVLYGRGGIVHMGQRLWAVLASRLKKTGGQSRTSAEQEGYRNEAP